MIQNTECRKRTESSIFDREYMYVKYRIIVPKSLPRLVISKPPTFQKLPTIFIQKDNDIRGTRLPLIRCEINQRSTIPSDVFQGKSETNVTTRGYRSRSSSQVGLEKRHMWHLPSSGAKLFCNKATKSQKNRHCGLSGRRY